MYQNFTKNRLMFHSYIILYDDGIVSFVILNILKKIKIFCEHDHAD